MLNKTFLHLGIVHGPESAHKTFTLIVNLVAQYSESSEALQAILNLTWAALVILSRINCDIGLSKNLTFTSIFTTYLIKAVVRLFLITTDPLRLCASMKSRDSVDHSLRLLWR